MENQKNSSGKIFIFIIPIIILISSFLYDNIVMSATKKKYHLDSESIIKNVLTNSYFDKEETVKTFYEEKKLETDQLNVRYEDNILYVYNVHTFPSFFGRLFGVRSYRTEVNLKAYKEGNEIIIMDIEED